MLNDHIVGSKLHMKQRYDLRDCSTGTKSAFFKIGKHYQDLRPIAGCGSALFGVLVVDKKYAKK